MLSPHSDLLSASPETEESVAALVEEIKNRARGVFAGGNYPEAELLYNKAIEVKADAVLYSNRSAARLNLGKHRGALDDADKAVELDAAYAKGWYRKGQAHNALEEFHLAYEAFEKGRVLEPGNKSFQTMVAKAKELAEKQKVKEAASAASMDVEPSASGSSSSSSKPAAANKAKAATSGGGAAAGAGSSSSSSSSNGQAKKKKEDEEEDFSSSDQMRGYKVLADGRKTTYFNKELSEEEKRLIGDIAPKKIQEASTLETKGTGAGSAWNYAGTFEEKNMTEWAKTRLKELVGGASFVVPGMGAVVDVVKVQNMDGDASITFTRGKKKFLYDLTFSVDWEAELDCGKAKGNIKYLDVTPDCDEDEYETQTEVDQLTPPAARHIVDRYVKSRTDGLQGVIAQKIKDFMREYQTM